MSSERISISATLTVVKVEAPHSSPKSFQYFSSQTLWTPCGARGVFGGQVIGQALQAASKTVRGSMGLHSQHCYFLLPADASVPIIYGVERLREGKSYSTRLVKALQKDRPIFILLASYALPPISLPPLPPTNTAPPFSFIPTNSTAQSLKTLKNTSPISHSLRFALTPSPSTSTSIPPDAGLFTENSIAAVKSSPPAYVPPEFTPVFQIPFPDDVLSWEECVPEEERWAHFIQERGAGYDQKRRRAVEDYIRERGESPISIAVAKRKVAGSVDHEGEKNKRLIWLKARLAPGEQLDDETVRAMFAYMTDFQFIGTAARSVGLTRNSTPRLGMLASLDHTTHFYPFPPKFDPSAPLLHVMDSPLTHVASGRGVVRGLLYTADGYLVATTLQEGVVRADLGGKEERGLVEGGGVGDDDEEKARNAKGVKAKL